MNTANPQVRFFMDLAKAKTIIIRRFDRGLGGLGFSEFMILYHLSLSPDEKMRRIDLAERVGLTASGVTRLLLPMEKIGLIKKEANALDARVSVVALAPSGKRILGEAMERAEVLCEDLLPEPGVKKFEELSAVLTEASTNALR